MTAFKPAALFVGTSLLGALCLALAGCAPPYIEALDRAAPLTRQMARVGTIGAVSLSNDVGGVRFLPTKPTAASLGSLDIQTGFVIQVSGGTEYLSFAFVDSSGAPQSSSFQTFSLSGADPHYPLYEYHVTATLSNQASVLVFKWDPATTSSSYQQFVAPLASGSMTSVTGSLTLTSTNTIFAGQTIIASCDLPPPPSTQDTFAFLGQAAGVLSTATATLNGSATAFPVGGAMTPVTATVPGTVSRYTYNPSTTASYSAYYNGSQWIVQQWIGIGAPTSMTGITHRVDGILTTGDLVSTEGGVLRLYDAAGTGTELYAIPLNGLEYSYEAYVGSTPYVFFSLPMQLVHGDWVFNVYAVPTSSMRSLGG